MNAIAAVICASLKTRLCSKSHWSISASGAGEGSQLPQAYTGGGLNFSG